MADHDHATSSPYFIYDVFLSFRGDTRYGFTDYLYRALDKKGIKTFRDDRDLELGNEISATLLDTIEKSRMSIVVLCRNYASSTWCLDELVKIMECKDKGRPVIPVFYHVEPGDVRYQLNQYETAMIKHENRYGRDSPRLAAWRSALVAVSNLSGKSCNNRPEREIINKIVKDVEDKKICIDEGESEGNKRRRIVEEEDVVGFMSNFCAIINQLKEKDSSRNVVSITGMGGLGKTTLARKIYNSNEVKKLFPYCAWSCVSKDYEVRKILVSLLHCLKSSKPQNENLTEEKLGDNVKECLNGKKYLVVLDDVWETQVWDKVKGFFPNNNNGSMILITTRNNRVANYTRSKDPHHQLPFLDEEESWELFCKKVFCGEECPSDLELIGRSIVKSCRGLPLTIITLARAVAKRKRSQIEWQQIARLVPCWYIAEDEDSTKVMQILKFSYDDLSKELKQCFLYFGIYPEDYEIPVRELIQLWIAEKLIQLKITGRSNVPQLEDVGEEYLKDLVDRNLVQVAERRSDGEGVKTCWIYYLLRELCISESNKVDNILEVHTGSNENTMSDPRRLSFLCDAESYISSKTCDQLSPCSLFFFYEERQPNDILKHFQSVNVLRFETMYVEDLPETIDLKGFIHLRYLRIHSQLPLFDVEDCIGSLQNLETLYIDDDADITRGIWKLKRLRHLHSTGVGELLVEEQEANDKTMQKLQTLCCLHSDPQLECLLNKGSFPNLRKLTLMGLHLRSLHCLSNLRTLKLYASCDGKDGDVFSRSCEPTWPLAAIAFPSNLTKITLRSYPCLDSKSMDALGRITNLQILKLYYGKSTDSPLNCGAAGNFPQLQVFHMDNMHVTGLILEEGAMPRLRRVVFRACTVSDGKVPERLQSLGNLREVPDFDVPTNKYWETASTK